MPETPFISVIVTAYNRKQFLPQALVSLVNQTLVRSRYEIIVVKNFADEIIDSQIKAEGIISLERGKEIVGSYLARGIEKSTGEVLVFLDDDDEFFQNKLQVVQDIFANAPSICYYHNGVDLIDSSGKELSFDFRKGPVKYLEEQRKITVRKPLKVRDANKLFRAAAYGYLSSISVRKSVVVPFIPYLENSIESVQDIFTFYCALLSSSCDRLVIDPMRLTKYRIHAENASLFSDKQNSTAENTDRIFKFLSREERSLEAILNMSNLVEDAQQKRIVRKMIGYELYSRKVNLNMVDPSATRKKVLSDALSYFKFSFRSRFFGSQVTILVRSILWVFFPRTTRRIFVKRFST